MITTHSEQITVQLSMEKIRNFLNNLPDLSEKLEEKKKMAYAAINYLDSCYTNIGIGNEACANKPTLPGIGAIEFSEDKSRISAVDYIDFCSSKPQIPTLSSIIPCSSKPQIPNIN